MGIEPTYSAWKAEVLPLNYTRIFNIDAQVVPTRIRASINPPRQRDLPRLDRTYLFGSHPPQIKPLEGT